jgi:hypothetical protein
MEGVRVRQPMSEGSSERQILGVGADSFSESGQNEVGKEYVPYAEGLDTREGLIWP